MRTDYTDIELDALRELANIGAGTAATSLSGLLGMTIDVNVPTAATLALGDAIAATGPADACVTGVAIPFDGDLPGTALMLFPERAAATLSGLLGLAADSEYAASALGEVVNILCAAYLGALGDVTGIQIKPDPPEQVVDRLGGIIGSILALSGGPGQLTLMLDSALIVAGEACSLSFLLIPSTGGIDVLLRRLGLGS